jgi:putative hydrolase of the HAD superfamily
MDVKAVLFDLYGTLIDIETDERDWSAYLNLAKYLSYRGVSLSADEIRWFYFEKMHQHRVASREKHPEMDVRKIWYEILKEHEAPELYRLNLDEGTFLSDFAALQRALTRKRFMLYPPALYLLQLLKPRYRLGIVSDCQVDYAIPEMKILGIYGFFNSIVVSAEHGFRKPDQRLFELCLSQLQVEPHQAVFVGNDAYRDIGGAKSVGMKTILVMSPQGSKETSAGEPDHKVDDLHQVTRIFKR